MNLKILGDLQHFWQWDANRKLLVDDDGACSKAHFCNGVGGALVCPIKNENGMRVVDVPNILLQQPNTIKAYLIAEKDGSTITRSLHRFNVLQRSKPDAYVYAETEVLNYDCLVNRLNQIEHNSVSDDRIDSGIERYMAAHQNEYSATNIKLADRVTGQEYTIYIQNGKLMMEEV